MPTLVNKNLTWIVVLILASLLFSACTPAATPQADPAFMIVATTSMVADVVRNVTGPQAQIYTLIPPGSDPHTFEPTPQDAARLADADIIFANGLELESFLPPLLESANASDQLVEVSDGIEPLMHDEHENEGDDHEGEEHEEHDHAAGDPHVWTDPNNVILWVENIRAALSEIDSANAEMYASNAAAYTAELQALNNWITQQVNSIPAENRLLVTDHETLEYFAQRYGFKTAGAIIPGISTLAQPSAQEIAALEDAIRAEGVTAIFTGVDVNPSLAQRIAADTGAQIIFIYSGSLSASDGPASTYLEYIRYNVGVIADALR